MIRIGRRPVAVKLPPAPSQSKVATASAQAAREVGHALRSGFEATAVKSPQAAQSTQAAQPTQVATGTWRAPADSELGRTISGMLERLSQSDIRIKGDTPESLFRRAILDNKKVTNEQLLAMSKVPLEALASSPEEREKTLKRVPNARELDVHKFTVAMMAAVTGIDPQKLSEATPDLGLTGAPNTPLLYAAKTERMQLSTALHDFTDYLRGAGIKGLNKAVWGTENRILSAIVSAVGGGRY